MQATSKRTQVWSPATTGWWACIIPVLGRQRQNPCTLLVRQLNLTSNLQIPVRSLSQKNNKQKKKIVGRGGAEASGPLWFQNQPDLQIKPRASQSYTVRPSLKLKITDGPCLRKKDTSGLHAFMFMHVWSHMNMRGNRRRLRQVLWHRPKPQTFTRLRQWKHNFKTCLGYKVSSRPPWAIYWESVSKFNFKN